MSLQLLGIDIRHMSKGLKEATKELVENKQNKKLKVSQRDGKITHPRETHNTPFFSFDRNSAWKLNHVLRSWRATLPPLMLVDMKSRTSLMHVDTFGTADVSRFVRFPCSRA